MEVNVSQNWYNNNITLQGASRSRHITPPPQTMLSETAGVESRRPTTTKQRIEWSTKEGGCSIRRRILLGPRRRGALEVEEDPEALPDVEAGRENEAR